MTPESLFPLPMVPIEEYMLHDDRPEQPMTMFCRFRFRGGLDRDVLTDERLPSLDRHPLMRSVVEPVRPVRTGPSRPSASTSETSRTIGRRGTRYRWRLRPSDTVPIRFRSDPAWHATDTWGEIDPFTEAPLRIWLDDTGPDLDMTFQVHHAAADGLGSLQLAMEYLTRIHHAIQGRSPERLIRSVDFERLAVRHRFELTPWKLVRIAPQQAIGLAGAAQFLSRKPVPLVGLAGGEPGLPSDRAGVAPGYPAFETRMLSREQTERYAAVATRLGRTTNDLIARDVFVAVDHWRRSMGLGRDDDWIRMMVPVNMRQYPDRRLPAANCVSMVFLDRTPAQIADPARLLDSINDEVQLILRNRLGLTFLFSLQVAQYLPGGIAAQCRNTDCRSSLILTNLGEPLARLKLPRTEDGIRVGEAELVGMDLVAPLRPLTNLGLSAFRFEGRQGLTLHWNPRAISHAEGRDLLGRIGTELTRTAHETPSETITTRPTVPPDAIVPAP